VNFNSLNLINLSVV